MQVQTNDLKFILVFGLVIATGLVMLLCLPKISWGQNIVSNITIDDIQFPFVVSTRNHFNPSTGKLEDHNATDYDAPNIPWLNKTSACPPEIAIFIHGWGLDKSESNERFDRVKMSLVQNGYNMPVIGFTWDAKALWPFAQHISKENGPKLGQFISDLKNNCEQLKIRLIGHSLGARVVLSSLDYLQNKELWNSKNFKIESVHLLGAAVDNEEISTNKQVIDLDATNWGTVKSPEKTGYGQAVQEEVIKFYNLYNPEDSIFEPNAIYPLYPFQIYPSFEGDWALGQNGYQTFPNDIVPNTT